MISSPTAENSASAGLSFSMSLSPEAEKIFSLEAQNFIAELAKNFMARRDELLQARVKKRAEYDAGILPDFLPQTREIREGAWKAAPIPPDLQDRRVEITGPVDRKMIINALNSGAKTFMADFEDSASPTFQVMVEGQLNLSEAIAGSISYLSPEGKKYSLAEKTAVLIVRPRGWHLPEKHVFFGGHPIAGALMDFGLYFFHNAKTLLAKGTGPYFYLPKMESHLEARLWNDIFVFAQNYLDIPQGSIRATALIETLPAAFEMDEILYELRPHAAGLNCGRWDYIFSFIKCFRNNPDYVLPERGQVTMTTHFLRSYSKLLIKTCHKRGVHAMGGMAAQIPNKDNPAANQEAMRKVTADKEREATDGHDGTWVGHPGLVPVALAVFNEHMPTPNQIAKPLPDYTISAEDLLALPHGTISAAGLRQNISVCLQYMEAWLRGQGCVPLYYLMEDAATAEISRVQLWQWVHYPKGILDDGRRITIEMVRSILNDEVEKLRAELGENFAQRPILKAAELIDKMTTNTPLQDFLTLEAYRQLG